MNEERNNEITPLRHIPFDVESVKLDLELEVALLEFGDLISSDVDWRENIELEIFQELSKLIGRISGDLKEEDELKFKLYAQIFRFCRNACSYSEGNQVAVGIQTKLGEFAIEFTRSLIDEPHDNILVAKLAAICCAIQLTFNALTLCPTVCDYYCDTLKYIEDLRHYVSHPVYKISYLATMTALQIYKTRPLTEPISSGGAQDILENSEQTYTYVYTNALCTFVEFLEKEFSTLSTINRLITMKNIASGPETAKLMSLSVCNFFIARYKQHCEAIFSSQHKETKPEFLQELKWLVVLMVNISSLENEKNLLMRNDELLVAHTVGLLCKIHKLGKASSNCFTAIEKLEIAAPNGVPNPEIEHHPSFQIKVKLMALLTHLCSEHRGNQNIVRKRDGISVILECTKIDARNPLLPQYAIFALKCILEGNLENQDFVKNMEKQGYMDSEVLREFGIQISNENLKGC